MKMIPSTLPDKTSDERVAVYFQLAPALGTQVIVGLPVFTCDPLGLTFEGQGTIDGAQTAAAFVAGGEEGSIYTVTAICTLSTGEIVEPAVSLPVVTDQSETRERRPVVL